MKTFQITGAVLFLLFFCISEAAIYSEKITANLICDFYDAVVVNGSIQKGVYLGQSAGATVTMGEGDMLKFNFPQPYSDYAIRVNNATCTYLENSKEIPCFNSFIVQNNDFTDSNSEWVAYDPGSSPTGFKVFLRNALYLKDREKVIFSQCQLSF